MRSGLPDVFQTYLGKTKKEVKKDKEKKFTYLVSRNGLIRLELAAHNYDSKTFIKHLQTRSPLLVQRALYPNADFHTMAHIFLMSSAGGILQDDKFEIEIVAGKNTSSYITTQAATKIYKMENGYASQYINIFVYNGSYLEFNPEQIIPYRSSRFYQEVNLKIGLNSTLMYCETVSAGRIAKGEIFEFDICFLKLIAYDQNDKIIFIDMVNMEPTRYGRDEFDHLFGSKTIWSTVYIITTNSTSCKKLFFEINSIIKSNSIQAGCSSLPNDYGIVIRTLSESMDETKEFIRSIAKISRTIYCTRLTE